MWGWGMNTENLWKNFLAEVAEEVSPTTYQVWFNDLILLKIDQNIIKIQVPMEIHKKHLRDNYKDLIVDTFFDETNNTYDREHYN